MLSQELKKFDWTTLEEIRDEERQSFMPVLQCLDFIARAQACVQDCSTVWNREEAEFNSSLGKDGWCQMDYYKQEDKLTWVKGQREANSVSMTEQEYEYY